MLVVVVVKLIMIVVIPTFIKVLYEVIKWSPCLENAVKIGFSATEKIFACHCNYAWIQADIHTWVLETVFFHDIVWKYICPLIMWYLRYRILYFYAKIILALSIIYWRIFITFEISCFSYMFFEIRNKNIVSRGGTFIVLAH